MLTVCPECKKRYNGGYASCPVCGSALVPVSAGAAALRFFGSMALAMLLTVFLTILAVSMTARAVFDEKNAEAFAESIDIMSLPAEGSVENGVFTEGATVQDELFAEFDDGILEREDIRTIYERSTFPAFVREQIVGYMRYISKGESYIPPTAERIKKLFDENIDVINSVRKEPLTDEDLDEIYSGIDDAFSQSDITGDDEVGAIFRRELQRLYSTGFAVFICALCGVSLLLIYAVNRSGVSMLRWGGAAFILCGLAALLLTVSVSSLPDSSLSLIGTLIKNIHTIISPDMYTLGGIYTAIGIIMHIIGAAMGKSPRRSVDMYE